MEYDQLICADVLFLTRPWDRLHVQLRKGRRRLRDHDNDE